MRLENLRADEGRNFRASVSISYKGYMMTVSQPSTLLLEESGTFEGAAPVQYDACESGVFTRKHRTPGDAGDRFEHKTQESISWIDGRMSISF